MRSRRPAAGAALLAGCLLLAGCRSAVEWVGIRLLYQPAELPAERVLRDLPYRQGPGTDGDRNRLDLYLPPAGTPASAPGGWPALVFVHGGGWTAGDRGLEVAGADVYGNIGRFYASRGIATAVIGYRLQPAVTWREQVADVAAAAAWVYRRAAEHGADPGALFLAGHSAGAQLAAKVALDPRPLAAEGLSPEIFCGVIPVSGAGFDLADRRTYELGAERSYYEERFRAGDPGDGWLHDASAVPFITPQAPPFLLLFSRREWPSLRHQNRLLHAQLLGAGVESRLVEIPDGSHSRIVLALSHPGKAPSETVLGFIREAPCTGGGAAAGG